MLGERIEDKKFGEISLLDVGQVSYVVKVIGVNLSVLYKDRINTVDGVFLLFLNFFL
jgi:hypothetical protein